MKKGVIMIEKYKKFRDAGGWVGVLFIGLIITTGGDIAWGGPNLITHFGQTIVCLSLYMGLSIPRESLKEAFSILNIWYRPSWATPHLEDEKLPTFMGGVFLLFLSILTLVCARWQFELGNSILWAHFVMGMILLMEVLKVLYAFMTSALAIIVWRNALNR